MQNPGDQPHGAQTPPPGTPDPPDRDAPPAAAGGTIAVADPAATQTSAPGDRMPWLRNLVGHRDDIDAETRMATLAPKPRPAAAAAVLVGLSFLAVAVVWPSSGDGFLPRVASIDGLAGLAIGAFLVDRLLTFVPPVFVSKQQSPEEREAAVAILRFGFGAAIAAAFVALTGLQAVQAIVGDAGTIPPELDRVFAVVMIAGGTAGLAGLSSAMNGKKLTDAELKDKPAKPRVSDSNMPTMPPPAASAYLFGAAALIVAAVVAGVVASGDTTSVDLLSSPAAADPTAALVIRFGLLFVAAGVAQQLVSVIDRGLVSLGWPVVEQARGLVLGGVAVVIGVLFAAGLDVYLLHNLGFFGTEPGVAGAGSAVDAALASSTDAERIFDLFITGIVIAAGTKPINDLSTRLRAAKQNAQQRTATSS